MCLCGVQLEPAAQQPVKIFFISFPTFFYIIFDIWAAAVSVRHAEELLFRSKRKRTERELLIRTGSYICKEERCQVKSRCAVVLVSSPCVRTCRVT